MGGVRFFLGGGARGVRFGVRVDVNEELILGGRGGVRGGRGEGLDCGVRVDVNEELKFL